MATVVAGCWGGRECDKKKRESGSWVGADVTGKRGEEECGGLRRVGDRVAWGKSKDSKTSRVAYRVSDADEIVDINDPGRSSSKWRGGQGGLDGLVLWWARHLNFWGVVVLVGSCCEFTHWAFLFLLVVL